MTVLHVSLRQVETQRETRQELTLDGVRVVVVARYAAVTDRWYASLYNTSDVLLIGSLACVAGVDLLRPYKHLAIPQGQLFCHAVDREPPTFATLDSTARVLYRTVS